jgi:hypothetical protein
VNRTLQFVFAILVGLAIAQIVWQHDRLPGRVATHFNAAGDANGFVSRDTHTAWHAGTILFMAALFQGLALAHRRLPLACINLPHRDYWLAPERVAATRASLDGTLLLAGCAVLGFFIAVFDLVYRANLAHPPHLGAAIWYFAGGLLGVVAAAIGSLLFKFIRRPAA